MEKIPHIKNFVAVCYSDIMERVHVACRLGDFYLNYCQLTQNSNH